MSLKEYTNEQLVAELKRREEEALGRPKLKDMDDIYAGLRVFVGTFDEWFTQCVTNTGNKPKDAHYYTFESVIRLLYEYESYFEWLNKRATGSE